VFGHYRQKEVTMLERSWSAARWTGILVFSVWMAFASGEVAQAGWIAGGGSEPGLPGTTILDGVISVQVYQLSVSGGTADPYGAGISRDTLFSSGFFKAGVDQYLYLYQTTSRPISIPITLTRVAYNNSSDHFAGVLHGFGFASPPAPTVPSLNLAPGVAASFVNAAAPVAVVAGPSLVATSVLLSGTTLDASFTGNLSFPQSSELFGFTSSAPPTLGAFAACLNDPLYGDMLVSVPEPATITIFGIGMAAMAGYRRRRRARRLIPCCQSPGSRQRLLLPC
jgi:hypothetical protein